jgi:hypothetical protein
MGKTTIDEILDKPILETKTPWALYFVTISIAGVFILFFTFALIGRLDIGGSIFCFSFISLAIYANYGRFLAKVRLYRNRIEVTYYFPWYSPVTFEFDKLAEIDHQPHPLTISFRQWYYAFQKLDLTNSNGNFCNIRYNINHKNDKELLLELSKKLIKKNIPSSP